jgi:hypothetical protein
MPRKTIARLTEDEIEILKKGVEDPNLILDYFTRKPGQDHGFRLDDNFEDWGKWQAMVCKATQKRIVVIGGFGSGKTKGIGASAIPFCLTTKDFKFMNAAPVAWQSELMYKFIKDDLGRDTRFGDLIYNAPKSPYPNIEFRFYVGNYLMVTTMEFMSAEKNGNNILSWEGDWVNIEEAGLLDDLGGTITNLGTRMRGTINNRERLARMSMISNSWDDPELWYRYDLAKDLPDDYLSITVSSRANKNVTPDQLRLMLRDIPEDEHERFIEGGRPEGKGNYFSKEKVYACEDSSFDSHIVEGVKKEYPGFGLSTVPGAGVVYYRIPRGEGHNYIVIGDPGISNAPGRNSPVLGVWDVTDFPKYKMSLAAFWWGAGNGSITPFIRQLLTFMAEFDPITTAVDATGPQRNTNELLNLFLQGRRFGDTQRDEWLGGIDVSKVTNLYILPMDFSSGKKSAFLIAGRLYIEAGLMSWPRMVTGIRSQLTNYDPAKDTGVAKTKLTQDIVSMLCMSAFAARQLFYFEPEDQGSQKADQDLELLDPEADRMVRLAGEERSIRSTLRA